MKAVVAAFNQEKALVGAFSVITNLRMELFEALEATLYTLYTVSTKCDYSLECGARQHGQPPPVVGPRPTPAITRTWLGCPLGCPLGPEEGAPNLLGGQARNLIEIWGLLMYDEFSVFSINENNVNQLNKINPNNV